MLGQVLARDGLLSPRGGAQRELGRNAEWRLRGTLAPRPGSFSGASGFSQSGFPAVFWVLLCLFGPSLGSFPLRWHLPHSLNVQHIP